MTEREEKMKRPKKQKKLCKHKEKREVRGRDREILWRECKKCNYDFPLISYEGE